MIDRGLLHGNVMPFIFKKPYFCEKERSSFICVKGGFCFTKYWEMVLGIIKHFCIHICTYKYALYICEQIRDLYLINLNIQCFQVCGDWLKKKSYPKVRDFFIIDDFGHQRPELTFWFLVFQVDRKTRLCFYLCDTTFIYDPRPEPWGSCAFPCVQSIYNLQVKTKTLALFWEQCVLGSLF